MSRLSYFILGLLFALLGCGGGTSGTGIVEQEDASTTTIECGVVIDPSGQPVENSIIQNAFGQEIALTSAHGYLELPLESSPLVVITSENSYRLDISSGDEENVPEQNAVFINQPCE